MPREWRECDANIRRNAIVSCYNVLGIMRSVRCGVEAVNERKAEVMLPVGTFICAILLPHSTSYSLCRPTYFVCIFLICCVMFIL